MGSSEVLVRGYGVIRSKFRGREGLGAQTTPKTLGSVLGVLGPSTLNPPRVGGDAASRDIAAS